MLRLPLDNEFPASFVADIGRVIRQMRDVHRAKVRVIRVPHEDLAPVLDRVAVYGFLWNIEVSYPLLSMLLVRVNGNTWWQGMNIGSPAATGGTVSSAIFTVPLFGATFNPGDRITVGAHAPKTINSGDAAPSFPAGALTITEA